MSHTWGKAGGRGRGREGGATAGGGGVPGDVSRPSTSRHLRALPRGVPLLGSTDLLSVVFLPDDARRWQLAEGGDGEANAELKRDAAGGQGGHGMNRGRDEGWQQVSTARGRQHMQAANLYSAMPRPQHALAPSWTTPPPTHLQVEHEVVRAVTLVDCLAKPYLPLAPTPQPPARALGHGLGGGDGDGACAAQTEYVLRRLQIQNWFLGIPPPPNRKLLRT